MLLLRLLYSGLLICSFAFAKTYEIAEPDFLSEIESKKFEFVKKIGKETEKAKERFYSQKWVSLPPSKKDYVYYVDPTYTLERDIPKVNKKGQIVGILYKKGTKVNPLDYIQIKPPPMIIFNACDDRQVFLVRKLMKEKKRFNYILISGGCSINEIKEKKVYSLLERIYMLTDELVRKLKLKNTISFVDADLEKRRIKVEVIKATTN